ncbi:MAG TPA: sulfate adenylyltransferase, partial [Candidatus Dormibacteraeota bacterium]|nr:sulfate adenylyltransferase [Candidatus Dormibacteraeota bacterium]
LAELGRSSEILDGDEVRTHLSKGLGFTKEDRDTNIRRIGFVARLLARNGAVAIAAAISPYRETRDEVRQQTAGFVEVHVRCSMDELVRRDVKGLYRRALAGELPNFTGITAPYEDPLHPEVVVDTERETAEESVDKILRYLARRGYCRLAPTERAPSGEARVEARAAARELPRLAVGPREWSDLTMLAQGALAPLDGFMTAAEYASVVDDGRLPGGDPFTLPVTLRLAADDARRVRGAERVALWSDDTLIGTVGVAELFSTSPDREAVEVYGTQDPAHPGVAALRQDGPVALAGPVELLAPLPEPFPDRALSPREVRAVRRERGWATMVGFQTRNPVHRAHEYLQKVALEMVDGLLLHPLVGETKSDDIPAPVRMACYEALLANYFPAQRVLLATNPAWMRYAGPREAVFHALVRRNYGCTHFIVGRDHAGVGSYYDTYAAHRIFDQYRPGELGIEILRFEHAFHCRACRGMASARSCPHPPEAHDTLSGTRVRSLLAAGAPLPEQFTRPEVASVLARAAAG